MFTSVRATKLVQKATLIGATTSSRNLSGDSIFVMRSLESIDIIFVVDIMRSRFGIDIMRSRFGTTKEHIYILPGCGSVVVWGGERRWVDS